MLNITAHEWIKSVAEFDDIAFQKHKGLLSYIINSDKIPALNSDGCAPLSDIINIESRTRRAAIRDILSGLNVFTSRQRKLMVLSARQLYTTLMLSEKLIYPIFNSNDDCEKHKSHLATQYDLDSKKVATICDNLNSYTQHQSYSRCVNMITKYCRSRFDYSTTANIALRGLLLIQSDSGETDS